MKKEVNIRLNANRAKAVHTGLKFASGDKGIVFKIAVEELDITDATAKIVFKRGNGTSVEAGITAEDGIYSYTTLGNEFAVVGPVTADVKFYENENRISTCTFVFDVTSDTLDGIGEGTAGYSDTLERMKKEMEEILEEMREVMDGAEADVDAAEKKMADLTAELEALYQEYVDAFGNTGPFNPRGDYSETENYTVRDMVYYDDATWVCYRNCTGETPSKESDCWQYFAVGAEVNLDDIINGTTQVGNAKTLDGHGAEYFATAVDLSNFLPLTGGKVGYLYVQGESKNGYSHIMKNASTIVDNGTDFIDASADNKKACLNVSALANSAYFVGNDNIAKTLLHTGNKPTGTYTGNGDATERKVETGGVGNWIAIYGASYMVLVSVDGAIYREHTSNTVAGLPNSEVNFYNGVLTIASTNAAVNSNGRTYTYQVL